MIDFCGVNLSEEDVPVERTVKEDELTELVLLWKKVTLIRTA